MKTYQKLLIVLIPLFILGTFFVSKVMISRPSARQSESYPHRPSPPEGHEKGAYSPVSIARDQCRKITNALRSFHSKRGTRPLPEGSPTDEKHVFVLDDTIIDALSGKDTKLNTAGVNYLKEAGITVPVKAGRFFAAFDFNQDGSIADPSAQDKIVSQDILVWTAGEDEKIETWSDNAFAWVKP